MTNHYASIAARLLIASFVAFLAGLPAQAHDVPDPVLAATSVAVQPALEVLTGTVDELTVEDRVNNTTHSFFALRTDDGSVVRLSGAAAQTLEDGARVAVQGTRSGPELQVELIQSLAAPRAESIAAPASAIGILAIAHADDFAAGISQFVYQVREDAGGVTTLSVPVLPSVLRGGMRVVVSGEQDAAPASIHPKHITIVAAPPKRAGATSGLVEKSTTVNTILVILANFNNTAAPAFTPAQAQQVMTTNAGSVANYYNEVSYGTQTLNVTVTSSWVTMNMAMPATCDWQTIGTQANAAALAANAAYNVNNYHDVVYLFPQLGSCGWAGLAWVGAPGAWINGVGAFRNNIVAHEMGHNFGNLHAGSLDCHGVVIGGASCTVAEYGDPYDTMGNQHPSHFNVVQKANILGWIPPSGVVTHGSGSANYTLSPIESPGGALYGVQIPTTNGNRTYWIEYRQPIGFDGPVLGGYSFTSNGAQIRVSYPFEWSQGSDDTELLDMTPATSGVYTDAALVVGQSFLDSTYNVNIIVTAATPTALTVNVTTSSGTATTTTLVSSLNPSNVGQSVNFTASVTGISPTGSVVFTDGGSTIAGCAAVTLAGAGNTRSAGCTTSALTAGTHSIVAAYTGDATNLGSSSTALTQTVKANTTTTVGSSLNPSTVGQSVTFTGTVTGFLPAGPLNFKDGAASIAGCSAVALTGPGNTRTATCTTSALGAASHSITATYGGDAFNNGSVSTTLTQVVNGAGPTTSTTTLVSSVNPSTTGQSVTFTGSVTGTNPTGSVNFTDGGASIAGCAAVALSGAGNTRTAACSTSGLSAATHSIVAHYGGDAGNTASVSATLSQVVNAGGASIDVALAVNGGTASASSTYVASGLSFAVSGVIDGDRAGLNWEHGGGWNSAPPANVWPQWVQITFNGQKTINQVIVYTVQDNYLHPVDPPNNLTFTLYGITAFQVQGWNGSAWVNLGAAVAGNNLVKRPVNFAAFTTNMIRVNVTGAVDGYARITEIEAWTPAGGGPTATTTTLVSSVNPSTVGQSVTFTATVTGTTPTGTVNFTDGGSSIAGCAAAPLSGGGSSPTATCTTSTLSQATHSIVANYGGDAGNLASASTTLSQVVNAAGQIDVALAANGGTASSSSTYVASGLSFAVSGIINGDRAGLNWEHGGGWNSAPPANAWPQWAQVTFNGQKTITQVIVYTVQDNWANPVDPPNNLTFTLYGITAFQVQGWNGSAWVNLGAAVAGNNLVKVPVNFAAFTTNMIRVNVTGSVDGYARITEVEAWGN